MKLLHRTSLNYLLFSGMLLLGAGFLLYFMLTRFINEEITEKLYINKDRIVQQIESGQPVAQLPPVIVVEEWQGEFSEAFKVRDVEIYDEMEDDEELFREIVAYEVVRGKTWKIVLRQVIPEPHDYWNSIGITMSLVLVFLLFGLLLINWRISRRIWAPFYANLAALKNFSLESAHPISLQTSKIKEFEELNSVLESLTEKIRSDYHSLREFTENASHEMQTPLAVLHSQLESALQVPELTEKQAIRLNSALGAARRLAGLNQTLLLLAKIENRQFRQNTLLSFQTALTACLDQFSPLIEAKNITLQYSALADPKTDSYLISCDPTLLDRLLSNLLGNAIRHNMEGGRIEVQLKAGSLLISNTGPDLQISPEKLFARFAKGDPSSPSHGLGLAIVQKICDNYGWTIDYQNRDGLHILKLEFPIQNSSKIVL
jgi:hypothetical protein